MKAVTQYYGYFFYKNLIQHVVVETKDGVITQITAYHQNLQSGFSLETYDATNKLQVNTLIHVYDTLHPDVYDDEVIDESPFAASHIQNWPEEPRLLAKTPS